MQELVPLIDRSDALAPISYATLFFKEGFESSVMLGYTDVFHSLNNVLLSTNSDSISIPVHNFLIIEYMHRNSTPFILLPNDRIEVSIDSAGSLKLQAQDAVRTNELNIFSEMVNATGTGLGGITMLPVLKENDFNRRNALLSERQKQVGDFIRQYARMHTMRPEVWQVTQEFIEHHDYFEKAMLLRLKGDNAAHDYQTLLASYLQKQTFFSYYFPEFRNTVALVSSLFIQKTESTVEDLPSRIAFMESHFDSSLVEPLCFLALNSSNSRNQRSYDKYYQGYLQEYPATEFTQHLSREMAFNKTTDKQYEGTQLLMQTDTMHSLEDIMASKRGKVLYIDFWASWCMPCLKEIPYSIELKKKYGGSNVEFLYVSMDKSQADWEKGQEKFPQVFRSDNSYLMLNNFDAPFAKDFKLQFIPRYMLVDQRGRIVNTNAPRPSDGEALSKVLEELML